MISIRLLIANVGVAKLVIVIERVLNQRRIRIAARVTRAKQARDVFSKRVAMVR